MALTTIDTNSIGAGTRFRSDEDDDDVLVLESVIVASTDGGQGLHLNGNGHDVEVRGVVLGISYQGSGGTDRTLHVTSTGQVADVNSSAVWFSGIGRVVNEGVISGHRQGLFIDLPDRGSFLIENAGTIYADSAGIIVFTVPGSDCTVQMTNTGTVQGGLAAYAGGFGTDLLANRGQMIGAVQLGGGNDLFDNRSGTVEGYVWLQHGDDILDNRGGTVTGNVLLDAGDDTFDNRGGTVTGYISGDTGNDLFRPGLSAETIDGGDDFDTLDFSSAARGLRVSLTDPTQNTREAAGDTYTGIERILGSRFDDTLIGDDLANILVGNGGRDRLTGGAGDDTLAGGGGRDRLTGGAGDDAFEFHARAQGGDRIADWGAAPGDDDLFVISVAGFGGGLVAGLLDPSQFRARASSNEASDADDRFIFRQDDETLWFDRDGRGGTKAVLIADLQDGAVVTANDVLLV